MIREYRYIVLAELWKLQKMKRTRLLLLTSGGLPWLIWIIFVLISPVNTGLNVDTSQHITILLASILTAILSITSLGEEFESGTFKTLFIQGTARWQIVVAKATSVVCYTLFAVLLWLISLALSTDPLISLGWPIIKGLALSAVTSMAYTGFIFAFVLLGHSVAGTALGLLFFLADMAMSILTQSIPPLIGPSSSSTLARVIWHTASFSISVNSFSLIETTNTFDAFRSITLLLLISIIGLSFSVFIIYRFELSKLTK